MMSRVEEILLKTSQFFKRANRRAFFTNTFFAGLALVGAAALSVSAQSGAMSPYQGESDGISVCTDNKYTSADFNPGIRLGPPDRPGFWGQPQMEVVVRVDDSHDHHGWNWNRDRFLSMDKGTTRELIGARVFKVEIPGRRGPEIAEFSPAGLDLVRVKQACDLTPRKPSKD